VNQYKTSQTHKITYVDVTKIPIQFEVMTFQSGVTASKITGPTFSKDTNSSHYVKLFLTPSLKELTEEQIMWDNPHSLQELEAF
jgi:hypothetical protein